MSEALSVEDLVDLIKNPTGTPPEARGACKLVKLVATLPEVYQEALAVAMHDTTVPHSDIVSFINNHTDITVSLSAVQRHRNKRGCLVCIYGGGR